MNSAKIAILGATASDAARWVAGLQPRGRRDGRHVECVVDCDPHGVRGGDLSHTFGSTRYAPRRMPWHPFCRPRTMTNSAQARTLTLRPLTPES